MVQRGGFIFRFARGGGPTAGGGLFDVLGREGVFFFHALVDLDDHVGEGCGGEEDLLVVGDVADGAVFFSVGHGWLDGVDMDMMDGYGIILKGKKRRNMMEKNGYMWIILNQIKLV